MDCLGQVKSRFTIGAHRAYVVKFNPDEDKQNLFLAGMSNKKIIQWDTRSGEIEQVRFFIVQEKNT